MHTLRLKLEVDKNTAYIMEKRFRILAHISNQMITRAKSAEKKVRIIDVRGIIGKKEFVKMVNKEAKKRIKNI